MHALDNLTTWRCVPLPDRRELAGALAAALGSDYAPILGFVGPEQLVGVRHRTGIRLLAIPGGSFEMGFTEADERALAEVGHPQHAELVARARPVHSVVVRPFLCSQAPLLVREVSALGRRGEPWILRDVLGGHEGVELEDVPFEPRVVPGSVERAPTRVMPAAVSARQVPTILEAVRQLRMLSEAEWELIARTSGTAWIVGANHREVERAIAAVRARPYFTDDRLLRDSYNALGLWGLVERGWIADGWHGDYRGAPATASAWDPPREPVVLRGGAAALYPWQAHEAATCHVAMRTNAERKGERHVMFVAHDLPELASNAIVLLDTPVPSRHPPRAEYEPGDVLVATVAAVGPDRVYLDVSGHGRLAVSNASISRPLTSGDRVELVVVDTVQSPPQVKLA